MRSMFSLVAILITVGLMMYLFAEHTSTISKANKEILPEVNQFSGRDSETGEAAYTTATLEPIEKNASMTAVRVTKVLTKSAYERYFGLHAGDVVTAVEYQAFKTPLKAMQMEDAKNEIFSGIFQKQGSLIVMRDNKELTLPVVGSDGKSATPTLQSQLDAMQKMPK